MPTYYFDSVAGNDSNPGTELQPLRGVSPLIRTYFASGNTIKIKCGSVYFDATGPAMQNLNATNIDGLTIESYGDGAQPRFDARQRILTGAWTLHAGNVWKRTVANTHMIERVWITDNDIEVFENPHRLGGAAGIDGEKTLWYWANNDPSAGQSTLYMWSGSGTSTPTQVFGSVRFIDRGTFSYSPIIMTASLCDDLRIHNIRLSGATRMAIDVRGCINVSLENVTIDSPGLYDASLRITNESAVNSHNVEILNINMRTSGRFRNYYAAADGVENDDPNGAHQTGQNDSIQFRCPGTFLVAGGFIEAGVHAGINIYSPVTSGVNGDINLTVDDVEFSCSTLMPYGRAFGGGRTASGGLAQFKFTNNVVYGQSTTTQLSGCASAAVANNYFAWCKNDFGDNFPDYYSTLKTHSKNDTARHFSVQSFNTEKAYGQVLVQSNVFVDSPHAPFSAEWYDGEPAAGLIVFEGNHVANVGMPWGQASAQRFMSRRTSGSWVPVLRNNTYQGAINPVVGLWNGSDYDNVALSNYGTGNVEQNKPITRPLIIERA